MTDIATLALAVDSRQVQTANKDLDNLSKTAKGAADSHAELKDGVDKLIESVEKLAEPFGRVATTVGAVRLGTHALALALGALALEGAKSAVEAFADLEKQQATYNAVLSATGYSAGRTGEDIENLAESIRKTTTATEGGVRQAAGALATFTSVTGDNFDRTLKLSQDLSVVMGGDISSAAYTLGRALESPTQGMTMLRRAGILLTQTQQDMIRRFMESGQVTQAQNVILDEVQKRVGGAGASVGSGLAGAYNQLGSAVNNWLESVGKQIDKSLGLSNAIRGIASALDAVNQNSKVRDTSTGKYGQVAAIDAEISERSSRPSTTLPALDQQNQQRIAQLEKLRQKLLDEADAENKVEEAKKAEAAAGETAADVARRAKVIEGVVSDLSLEGDELRKTALQRQIDDQLKKAQINNTNELDAADRAHIASLVTTNFYLKEGAALAQVKVGALGSDDNINGKKNDGDQRNETSCKPTGHRRDRWGAVRLKSRSPGRRFENVLCPALARRYHFARIELGGRRFGFRIAAVL